MGDVPPATKGAIRRLYNAGFTERWLMQKYKLSQSQIREIVGPAARLQRRWKHRFGG